MNNIYLFQPSSYYGGEICLPYAAGALVAYALSNEEIRNNYNFVDIIYRKDNEKVCLNKISDPFLVGFSCYIWNFEYNKKMARLIKQKYPECYIVFGGHNVSNVSSELMYECDYIDFLIHEEGEVPFSELLLALHRKSALSLVPNLSYREENKILKTDNLCFDVCDFPSPYSAGVFDKLTEKNDDVFYGIIETNRGCPYSCVYCDWGRQAEKVRLFPMERVESDIRWLSDHKIGYCICADANFGFFERDIRISQMLVNFKKQTGYPSKIQFCFTKNSDSRVFEINKAMNECGLSKGATISLQTLSEKALRDIRRTNMSFSHYMSLIEQYNEAGIFTYTDMILGLPGETLESFVYGIGRLFEAGQHSSVNIFNCERLINAQLSQEELINKHNIKFAKCYLNRHHSELSEEITENNVVVISTSDMSENDWIDANIFVAVTGAFHNLGLLQYFAIYLYNEKNINYTDFYLMLINHIRSNPDTVAGKILLSLGKKLQDVVDGTGVCETYLEEFGNVNWPVEEWVFLQIVSEFEQFFCEIYEFLSTFRIDEEVFEDLYVYQKNSIKRPFVKEFAFRTRYNFTDYYNSIYNGKKVPLMRKNLLFKVNDLNCKNDIKDYAREIVWYGRKGGRIMYKEEMTAFEDCKE